MSKYGNRKVSIDGISFDSVKEARRYCQLITLKKAGIIMDLELQKKYVLIPAQKIDDKLVERECAYKADFVYFDIERGREVVEDAKGVRTKEYIIKRKLMLYRYGIKIEEV